MRNTVGTGKELFIQSHKESDRPVMVRALGTNWDEDYCFVIERINIWGSPVGSEFIDGKLTRKRSFRRKTLLQMHSCRWTKQVFAYYGYTEPQKEETEKPKEKIYKGPLISGTNNKYDKERTSLIDEEKAMSPYHRPSESENVTQAAVSEPRSCRNCQNYKNNTCNGMRKAETCKDYVYMPTVSQETKDMWAGDMLATAIRKKEAKKHREH